MKKKTPKTTITFTNKVADKKELKKIIAQIFTNYGAARTSHTSDKIKELGFHYATKAGVSISIEDLKIPSKKRNIVRFSTQHNNFTKQKHRQGEVNIVERLQGTISLWGTASETLKNEVIEYFKTYEPLNPVYMMAFSGARGNMSQVRQLVGMRGLMSDPHGQLIPLPIKSNFKEGLTTTEYIISCYGARKGVVDTALKTANSGYLTRRLVDVAQSIVVREKNCKPSYGILANMKQYNISVEVSLNLQLLGRYLFENLYTPDECEATAHKNQGLTNSLIQNMFSKGITSLCIRSPLTCRSFQFVCQLCYGWSLANESLVDLGEAVGVIAAQSIGEPGTQLTMRTFHTGGVFTGEFAKQITAPFNGVLEISSNIESHLIKTLHGNEAQLIHKNTYIKLWNPTGENLTLEIQSNTLLFLSDKEQFKKGQILIEQRSRKNQPTETLTEEIISNTEGELLFQYAEKIQNKDKAVTHYNGYKRRPKRLWVLLGDVYTIPINTNILVKKESFVKKGEILATHETKTTKGGTILVEKNDLYKPTLIIASTCLTNANVIINEEGPNQKTNFILEFENTKRYTLLHKPGDQIRDSKKIGLLKGDISITNTSGFLIYYSTAPTLKEQQTPPCIYWASEERYVINEPTSSLIATNQTIIKKGQEIIKGVTSSKNGFLLVNEDEGFIKEIFIIEGGELYNVGKINSTIRTGIFQPGEEIYTGVIAQNTSCVDKIVLDGCEHLLVYPVKKLSLAEKNDLFEEELCANETTSIELNLIYGILFSSREKIQSSTEPVHLIDTYITVNIKSETNKLRSDIEFYWSEKDSTFKLKLFIKKNLLLKRNHFTNSNPKFIHNEFHIYNGKKIKKGEVIFKNKLLCKEDGIVTNITNNGEHERKLIILTEKHKRCIKIDKNMQQINVGDFLYKGKKLSPWISSIVSGQVLKIENNLAYIRCGTPHALSDKSTIYVKNDRIVGKNKPLATFTYEQPKTGDIIQGLPRIDEILEARKPKEPCLLAKQSGHIEIQNVANGSKIVKIIKKNKDIIKYSVKPTQKLTVSNGDKVIFGTKLTHGTVNPHDLLTIAFKYYRLKIEQSRSNKLSLLLLQKYLRNEVQNVYQSQGVQISDKHIEIIAKQMTSRVQIEISGDSKFLPSELVKIKRIEKVNKIIAKGKGKAALYQPILLGITKTSLSTDSFLSAASFQETIMVLSKAAVEGQLDWLTGLKENVAAGRLIPAGTGYRTGL